MTTLVLQVNTAPDDALQVSANCIFNAIGFDAGKLPNLSLQSGARFPSVLIPPGSTIDAATLTLIAQNFVGPGPAETRILAHDVDDAGDFTVCDIFDRIDNFGTAAQTVWDIPIGDWPLEGTIISPDFAPTVQEIIDRAGQASGDAIVILWAERGVIIGSVAVAYSYDNDPAKAPLLTVDFTPPPLLAWVQDGTISIKEKDEKTVSITEEE